MSKIICANLLTLGVFFLVYSTLVDNVVLLRSVNHLQSLGYYQLDHWCVLHVFTLIFFVAMAFTYLHTNVYYQKWNCSKLYLGLTTENLLNHAETTIRSFARIPWDRNMVLTSFKMKYELVGLFPYTVNESDTFIIVAR